MFNSVVGNEWSWNTRSYSDLGTTVDNGNRNSHVCEIYFDFNKPTSKSESFLLIEPEGIRLNYSTDLNLITIHKAVREKFIFILRNLDGIPLELLNLEKKLTDSKTSPIDIKFIYRKRIELDSYRVSNTGISNWENYKRLVIPILDEYTHLMSNEYKGYSSSGCSIIIDESKLERRILLIEKYINIINSIGILKIIAHKEIILKITCPGCSKEINSDSINDESGKIQCQCGFNQDIIKHVSEYSDVTKNIPQINSTEINIKDFNLFIDRYLCRSSEDYPKDNMWLKFDELCLRLSIPLRQNVINKLIPQPPMKSIIDLLQNSGYSQYYCIKNQIRNEYYNWPKPTMTEMQEANAKKLYVDFQLKYINKKKRKTNLNKDILGYVILYVVGVSVNSADFKIPSYADSISYSYQMIMEILPELCIPLENIPDVRTLNNN